MNYHSLDRPVRHLSVGPRRSRWFVLAAAFALVASLALAAILFWPAAETLERKAADAESAIHSAPPLVDLKLPPPDAFRPLTPEQAVLENEKRPFASDPGTPARPFTLRADAISRLRAVDCLTQAVYYEAASEGLEGGRAVAQVVLNRVRHPAYPNTVCGVVYEGSSRATGCQFTFTCDGSLARAPSAYLWSRSQVIASEALAGRVLPAVGLATHYHADYVLPYWADSLDKITRIGRHIFYRIRGGMGTGRAFVQRHPGVEPPPSSAGTSAALLEEALKVTEESADPLLPVAEESSPKPLLDEEPASIVSRPESDLAVDGLQGGLILDGEAGTPRPSSSRRMPAQEQDCAADRRQSVESIKANDLRVGTARKNC